MLNTKSHHIYLLREREFIKTNENIFKVGKSKQENMNRMRDYPNGSDVIIYIKCANCDETENIIIKEFKSKFNQMVDIGREYFEGDPDQMVDIIFNHVKIDISANKRSILLEKERKKLKLHETEVKETTEVAKIKEDFAEKKVETKEEETNIETKILNAKKIKDEIESYSNHIESIDSSGKHYFYCSACDYKCLHKDDYRKHCSTFNHLKKSNHPIMNQVNKVNFDIKKSQYLCVNCERLFETNSGLWRHKKLCKPKEMSVIDILIKDNKELKEMLVKRDVDVNSILSLALQNKK